MVEKAIKIYAVAHIIPLLIYKRKRLMKEPLKVLRKTFRNYVKSVAFITIFSLVGQFWSSKLRDLAKLKNGSKLIVKFNRSSFGF